MERKLGKFRPFPERNGADDRESYGNGSMNETFAEERDADPCSLILSTETHVSEALLIKVSHSIFDISDGVLPGVTYQGIKLYNKTYKFIMFTKSQSRKPQNIKI